MARNVQELIDERNTLLHDLLEARARLAAVLALCEYHKYDGRVPIYPLLAAARGEGDRPVVPCRHDGSNGTCAECRLTHLYVEGDQ